MPPTTAVEELYLPPRVPGPNECFDMKGRRHVRIPSLARSLGFGKHSATSRDSGNVLVTAVIVLLLFRGVTLFHEGSKTATLAAMGCRSVGFVESRSGFVLAKGGTTVVRWGGSSSLMCTTGYDAPPLAAGVTFFV